MRDVGVVKIIHLVTDNAFHLEAYLPDNKLYQFTLWH